MEITVNGSIRGDGVSNITVTTETEEQDVRTLAMSFLMFKIGKKSHLKLQVQNFLKHLLKKQQTLTYLPAYFLQEL